MEILEEKSKNKKCWNEEKMVAHARLVAGLAYLTPKRQRPALTCVLLPSTHSTNRLLTKSNRKSSCGWSFAYWTRYQQRWEVWQSACQHYFYSNGYVPFHPGSPWMWRMRHWIPMTQKRNKESLRWRFILFCFDKKLIIFWINSADPKVNKSLKTRTECTPKSIPTSKRSLS